MSLYTEFLQPQRPTVYKVRPLGENDVLCRVTKCKKYVVGDVDCG